jgi:hypothetical protein
LISGLLAIALLATLFFFEDWLTGQNWVVFVATVPAYLLLQVCAEGALEGVGTIGGRIGKFLPAALILAFYVLWFSRY